MKYLVAILAAILDFGMTMDTCHIFNIINEFRDLKNILLNTKTISLCAMVREIWLLKIYGSLFGSHIGFLKTDWPWLKLKVMLKTSELNLAPFKVITLIPQSSKSINTHRRCAVFLISWPQMTLTLTFHLENDL